MDGRGHSTVNTPRPPVMTVVERREAARYGNTKAQHVMVMTEAGWNPDLLIEWRKPYELPWEGRVVHLRLIEGKWTKATQWLPAGAIKQTE